MERLVSIAKNANGVFGSNTLRRNDANDVDDVGGNSHGLIIYQGDGAKRPCMEQVRYLRAVVSASGFDMGEIGDDGEEGPTIALLDTERAARLGRRREAREDYKLAECFDASAITPIANDEKYLLAGEDKPFLWAAE